jgi:hypothetical protein
LEKINKVTLLSMVIVNSLKGDDNHA